MKAVSRIWAGIEQGALISILIAMIGLAVTQIVLRNVFDSSLFWIDPLNRLLVLWLAIIGAMVATREGEHIAIDVLKHYLKGIWMQVVVRSTAAFTFAVCLLMAYHSGRFVWDEKLYDSTMFSGLPAWPFEIIMPIGFGLMAMRFFLLFFSTQQDTHQ